MPTDSPPDLCRYQSRNLRLAGKRTSMRLEQPMWDALEFIAEREKCSVAALCSMIAARKTSSNLTGCVRIFIIVYLRLALSPPAHAGKGRSKNAKAGIMQTTLAQLEYWRMTPSDSAPRAK